MSKRYIFLLLVALIFPYYQMTTWKYALLTCVIFYVFQKSYKDDYKNRLGINFKMQQLPIAFAIFAFCAISIEIFIQWHLKGSGYSKESPKLLSLWIFQPLFQSLNEELLGRALLIRWLRSKFKKYLDLISNICMSILFTLLHFAFCQFLFETPLLLSAGLVIFVATLAMNIIFMNNNNILKTWAIHFGINFSFFGGSYYNSQQKLLNDAEKFNLIYSSPIILIAAFLFLVIVSKFYLNTNKAKD